MNFAQLQSEVREVVRDNSPEIVSKIPTYINESVKLVVDIAGIPGFKSVITVATTVDQAYSSLPGTASGKVTYAGDSIGPLSVVSLEELVSAYPEMDEEGNVAFVAIEGTLMYYQKIPAAATDIYLVSMRDPVEMTGANDVPDGIPSYLHLDVIVPKAASLAYSKIEEGLEEGDKVNTRHWNREYTSGINKLLSWVGKRKQHLSRSFWRY